MSHAERQTEKYLPRRKRRVCFGLCTCGCCCCLAILFILLVVIGIVIAFFLWVRMPTVDFNGVLPPNQGIQEFSFEGLQTFVFNTRLNISVVNPNFIGAKLNQISVVAFYPLLPGVPFGNGTLNNVDIVKKHTTTLLFPFTLRYNRATDPDLKVLRDIAGRCGLLPGQSREQIKIQYELELHFSVLAITKIVPKFKEEASFDCPIPSDFSLGPLLGSILGLFRNPGLH